MRNLTIFLFFLALLCISPFIGAVPLDLQNILNPSHLQYQIFFEIRLPRVLVAFSAGALLALGGLVFQALFRNDLMTPYTLGISSGAVLGTGIAIKLGLTSLFFGLSLVSVFGFSGAMASLFVLLYLARFLDRSHKESLLLLGIALSLFFTAALMILFFLGNSVQNDMILHFTMGSLAILGWHNPLLLSFALLFTLLLLYVYRFDLQLITISEESAKLRGVATKQTTHILLISFSITTGVLVSITGPIGFVGLVVPHIVSKLYPVGIQKRIGKTALFGGFFLLFCDTIARSISFGSEVPIGIVTALIGGPFFIYLILLKKGV